MPYWNCEPLAFRLERIIHNAQSLHLRRKCKDSSLVAVIPCTLNRTGGLRAYRVKQSGDFLLRVGSLFVG